MADGAQPRPCTLLGVDVLENGAVLARDVDERGCSTR